MSSSAIRLLALAFILLAAPALADRKPSGTAAPKVREGRLAFGRPVPLWPGNGIGRDNPANLHWITFHRQGDSVRADVRLTFLSHPKGAWRVDLDAYALSGLHLARASGVFANSGTIITRPSIHEGDLRLMVGPLPEGRLPWRFRLQVTKAPAETEPTLPISEDGIGQRSAFPDWPGDRSGGRSMKVAVVDAGGRPAAAEVTIWRALEGPTPDAPPAVLTDPPVTWRHGGRTWTPILHTSPCTVEGLLPALYRVSANRGPTGDDPDPSPVGSSEIVDLRTGSKASEVTVRLTGRHPLTVRVLHARTGKPLAGQPVVLIREDGLPLGSGSQGFRMAVGTDGIVRFASLEPGRYSLEVGPRNGLSIIYPTARKSMDLVVPQPTGETVVVPHMPAPGS